MNLPSLVVRTAIFFFFFALWFIIVIGLQDFMSEASFPFLGRTMMVDSVLFLHVGVYYRWC